MAARRCSAAHATQWAIGTTIMSQFAHEFMQSMQNQLTDLFSDLRMSELSNFERKDMQITKIMNMKINGCIYIIELFRLGCEDHYTEMQDFLRE